MNQLGLALVYQIPSQGVWSQVHCIAEALVASINKGWRNGDLVKAFDTVVHSSFCIPLYYDFRGSSYDLLYSYFAAKNFISIQNV